MKYAIQYKSHDKKIDWVRDGQLSREWHPMLTPNVNMINKDWIFECIGDAQTGINLIVAHAKMQLKKTIAEYNLYHQPYNFRWIKIHKNFSDATKYTIVEYKPEFVFQKKRKLGKRDWIEGSAKSYCNNCGSSMYMGKYFQIGQSKVCAFCLETLGLQAKEHIDILDPRAREDHTNSIFVEEME